MPWVIDFIFLFTIMTSSSSFFENERNFPAIGECREIFPYMDPMGLFLLKCLKLFVMVSSRFKMEIATGRFLFIV